MLYIVILIIDNLNLIEICSPQTELISFAPREGERPSFHHNFPQHRLLWFDTTVCLRSNICCQHLSL